MTNQRDERSTSPARTMPAIDRALTDLHDVAELVPLLALLRDPSASRPWRETPLDPYRRAELDDEARAEQADRTEDAPGEHQDAARADVLDALARVLWQAQDLAAYVLRAVRCPVLPPASPAADPRPYLRRAAENLPLAVVSWSNGKEFAHFAADRAATMRAELEHALALLADGHVVKATCPWCHGGLAGRYTWRVRVLPGGTVGIVCESGLCNPPSRDAGTWWRGNPVWPFAQWPWLVKRLARMDRRTAALAAPEPPHVGARGATGRAGTPVGAEHGRALLAGLIETPDESDSHPAGSAA